MSRACLACGTATDGPQCPRCGGRVAPTTRFGLRDVDPAGESPLPEGLDPSRTFGRFTLADELGRGASGVVHRAWDPRLHRFVALKILTSNERPSLAPAFRHPGLARIHAAGPGWLARDLASGPTLRDAAAAMTLTERLERFASVCDAAQAALAWGLAPVDPQPGGIFLPPSGPFLVDYSNGPRTRTPERRLGELLYFLLALEAPARRPLRPKDVPKTLADLCLRALDSKATIEELAQSRNCVR